jgi:hypothetical protein
VSGASLLAKPTDVSNNPTSAHRCAAERGDGDVQRARQTASLNLKLAYPAGFPRNEESFSWSQGELSISELTDTVIFGSARGVMTLEVGVFLTGYFTRCIARRPTGSPPLRLFSDDRLVHRADTDYREMMANWVKQHRDAIHEVNLLTDSRLFAMAVAVGRLVVGGVLDTFHDVRAFDALLTRAVNERG